MYIRKTVTGSQTQERFSPNVLLLFLVPISILGLLAFRFIVHKDYVDSFRKYDPKPNEEPTEETSMLADDGVNHAQEFTVKSEIEMPKIEQKLEKSQNKTDTVAVGVFLAFSKFEISLSYLKHKVF